MGPPDRRLERTRLALGGDLVRFALVGALTTALNFVLFVGLIRLGLHYLPASAAGWAAGLLTSFVLNKSFTFAAGGPATLAEAGRFLGTYLSQLVLGTAGYVVLIDGLGLAPAPAFAINLLLVSLFSFTCLRWWVFRPVAGR